MSIRSAFVNPLTFWREWWRGLALIERAVVIVTCVMGVSILIISQAWAADTDISAMNSIWTVLIVSVVTGTFSPALLLWMTNSNKRQERKEIEAREDAREARTQAALETIKKQTDGVISQVASLAKATGHIEGGLEAAKVAEGTAATLALGQQQGRDVERESAMAKGKPEGDQPLPVQDKLTNETGERAARALESMANSAQKKPASRKKK